MTGWAAFSLSIGPFHLASLSSLWARTPQALSNWKSKWKLPILLKISPGTALALMSLRCICQSSHRQVQRKGKNRPPSPPTTSKWGECSRICSIFKPLELHLSPNIYAWGKIKNKKNNKTAVLSSKARHGWHLKNMILSPGSNV